MEALSSPYMHCFFRTENPFGDGTTQCKSTLRLLTHSRRTLAQRVDKSCLASADQMFDEIPLSDTFAWNNCLQTHLADKNPFLALLTYQQMLRRGVRPDKHTLPRILTACRLSSSSLFFGKQVHGQALKLGFSSNDYVISALVEMYGILDSANTAKWLLCNSPGGNNLVSWTLIAKLYILEEKPTSAIHVFNQLVESGAKLDPVALTTAIGACCLSKSLQEGIRVHKIAKKCGLEFDPLVSNSLLKMYADCGSIQHARAFFDKMPLKDTISWTAMVQAYVKNGGFNEGLKLCRQMIAEGLKPDSLTVSSILPACARVAAHKNGKEIHGYLLRNGIDLNLAVQNAVMDMYVKSGFIEYAAKIFKGMKNRDVVSLTVMILGYSLHGQGELGVDLFREVEKNLGDEMDQTIYAAVLHACSTACMVEEGKFYFNCIRAPLVVHSVLMVSLLARAGLFDEAKIFIKERQIERNPDILRAMLHGCRIHRHTRMGKQVIDQLCDLEPLNAENYVSLSNWYAESGRLDMVDKVRRMIRDMGLNPKKGCSWIELKNKVHVFGTGDLSHPRSERIYWELQCLMRRMDDEENKQKVYSDFSFHDVEDERECIPIGHSEMLALSFGLISTQEEATIRLTKNLRVCHSCHDSAKVISKMVGREIIIKDPNCFHHFKDGSCSCRDIW
ncbi:pentatricopeptide repeat-containing protein DOT4, chloroplastic-like [Malania oleifera]|uniref:pentatricopeptide repeat-containing protein DOT4, chloroplastic-like n=1 Tax=Malania oleifera TaxID=397392 RepID=UPI0025AE5BF5|nr:pentatricopeptide repeat-containing protein DOT4, chloroplastic-like [Malania oleifera]XP_057970086.1 pentatricopeptide repeat-containing protein DOT4, chloroplastic-like [Malania oleifera]XP_057970087.1 pentatricopeptide repeat-containing protein DOT4, chloroplastic-like [Malania oleifera]XP_057970088.1 pentatricopeptide repeat-containing protein DOT4, chloroplastic-like [Malania oleifera]XP_057970089.1 pentatricopeptide repeat-containing protein DOT4, chloroplastic-like [Malania oleifera]